MLCIFLKVKPTDQNGWRSTNCNPPPGFVWVRWMMRVRGRGESPEDMYGVGRVNDDRRWVQGDEQGPVGWMAIRGVQQEARLAGEMNSHVFLLVSPGPFIYQILIKSSPARESITLSMKLNFCPPGCSTYLSDLSIVTCSNFNFEILFNCLFQG